MILKRNKNELIEDMNCELYRVSEERIIRFIMFCFPALCVAGIGGIVVLGVFELLMLKSEKNEIKNRYYKLMEEVSE